MPVEVDGKDPRREASPLNPLPSPQITSKSGHLPSPALAIDSGCAGPFLAPGQRGRNGLSVCRIGG
jgi:hypothetical protein